MIWLRRYVEFLGDNPPTWSDICYTAALRRDHHDCRLAVLARTLGEGRELLQDYLAGNSQPNVFVGRKPYGRGLKVAFFYEGAQAWDFHGGCLTLKLPGFAAILNDIDDIVERPGVGASDRS